MDIRTIMTLLLVIIMVIASGPPLCNISKRRGLIMANNVRCVNKIPLLVSALLVTSMCIILLPETDGWSVFSVAGICIVATTALHIGFTALFVTIRIRTYSTKGTTLKSAWKQRKVHAELYPARDKLADQIDRVESLKRQTKTDKEIAAEIATIKQQAADAKKAYDEACTQLVCMEKAYKKQDDSYTPWTGPSNEDEEEEQRELDQENS